MPLKPTSKEDEYFAREECIKLRKLAAKSAACGSPAALVCSRCL